MSDEIVPKVKSTAQQEFRLSLDEIGLRHGTDKSSAIHDFLAFYERRLQHLRDATFTLLEVGVFRGGSIRTWSEYFPNATIVGLDVDPSCAQYQAGNAVVRIGDVGNFEFLYDVIAELGKPLVVIDDGSHRWDHQIATLQLLFPLVRPGGFYIVEDLDTSFEAHLRQAPFEGLSQISAFDYLMKFSRCVCAENALGDEKPYDIFMQTHQAIVGTIELGRRTAIISKKSTSGGGPI